MRKIAAAAVVLTTIVLSAGTARAWDDTGHRITAYIAWQRMTPEVRAVVHKILMAAPEDSHIAAYYTPYGSRSDDARKMEFFMLLATWADLVRERGFANRSKEYHHSNWHYDDKFWRMKDGRVEYLPEPEDGGLALTKLKDLEAMARGRATDTQKALAIVWLQHLIGDLHQPLHTSARVTEQEPNGDQGGNRFILQPAGAGQQALNLHWYWDSIVARNIPNSKNDCDSDYIYPLAESFMKKYPYQKMEGRLASGEFDKWAEESLALAQKDVFSADLVRNQVPSEKYMKKALAVAEERLTLAGYRMGELFNSIFSTKGPVAPMAPN